MKLLVRWMASAPGLTTASKKYRQSSKWNINSPPRFYSLCTDSRLLWHQNRTLTHLDVEFLKTPTFTYCSPLRDVRMINGGLGGQVVILTQRECIILTWLMIKECILAAGLSSINATNDFIYELVLNRRSKPGLTSVTSVLSHPLTPTKADLNLQAVELKQRQPGGFWHLNRP